jgi:hypothetical protein
MNLERKDLAVIGTALGISLISGLLKASGVNVPLGPVSMLVLPAGIISIVFVYLAAQQYGGEIARYLYFIALGIGWFMLMTLPHITWHQSGAPALLGLDPSFWYVFYHGGILTSYFFIGYGFYLFYRSGQ